MTARPADGIDRLTIPTPLPQGSANLYVLHGDPLTLVDTRPDWGSGLVALEAQLASLTCGLEEVKLVVLTQDHPGHAGHAGHAATISRHSGAQVAALHGASGC